MQQLTIQRDAPVMATDGELGRVKHVVVDPQTREVTEIVVHNGDAEWLIPMRSITGLDGDAVLLDGARAQFRSAPGFRRGEFEPVDDQRVQAEAADHATHGGAPLRLADDDMVVAGGAPAVDDTAPIPRPTLATALDGEPEIALDPDMPIDPGTFVETDTAAAPEPMHLEGGAAQHLELREERLRVDKEEVQAGVVRARKVVREWVETVEVPLREEHLVLEVLPGSGRVVIDGRELVAGDVFEVPLVEQQASVVVETVVSEDVTVRKESVEVQEQYQETLRREELVVDRDGDLDVQDEAIDEDEWNDRSTTTGAVHETERITRG